MSWWRPRSVRVQLTLWYMGALSTLLVAYAVGVYGYVRHQLFASLDETLHEDVELAEDMLEVEADGEIHWREGDEEDMDAAPGTRWLEVRSPGSALLLSRPNPEHPLLGDAVRGERFGPASVAVPGEPGLHVRVVARPCTVGGGSVAIVAARSEQHLLGELAELLVVLIAGIPAAVLLAGLGGYVLARRALDPVNRITERARSITAERLSERLPVVNPDDELGRLATVFNDAFARLERSFEELRRFTADASHELRTPLTAMRSVGEVGLRARRSDLEYREIIGSMLEEVDRLARLVDSLLTLSRADGGHAVVRREAIDLRELVRDVVLQITVLAEEKRQSIAIDANESVSVRADRAILRRALMNLIDNAIRYSPPGAMVLVAVKPLPDARVEISDHGPGIDPRHLPRIFDRFYRVDQARSRDDGGTGLGLAIARWAVEAHGGRIEVESMPGQGATFRIILPSTS